MWRGPVEGVDREVGRACSPRDGADLVGFKVVQGLGVAVGVDAIEDRLVGRTRQEDTLVAQRQGQHVLVAGVPQEAFLALGVDDEDLPRNPGSSVGLGALGIGEQRPDMFRRQLGERPGSATLDVDGKDATARGGTGQKTRVGSGGERGDPGCGDLGYLVRLAGTGGDRHGVNSPLVAGAKIGRAAVGAQGHAPGKGRIQCKALRLHARDHLARGQHHAGRGLAFLEIFGRGLAKKTRGGGKGDAGDQQPGGCKDPGKAWLHRGT